MRKILAAITIMAMAVVAAPMPAQAEDTGGISGHYFDSGVPVANVSVSAGIKSSVTDADGAFSITGLAPGDYQVSFRRPGWPLQFAHGKTEFYTADPIKVSAGSVEQIEEQALPTTLVNGHFTAPQEAEVSFLPRGSGGGAQVATAQGDFALRIFAGRYVIQYRVGSYSPGVAAYFQYSGRTDDFLAAQIVDIPPGVATVDDSMLPTGAVRGRFAANALVGLYRDGVYRASVSTDAAGNFALPYIRTGSWKVSFQLPGQSQWAFGKLSQSQADTITITEGQQTEVVDTLLPTGSLRVTVTDKATGAPIRRFQVALESGGNADATDGVAVLSDVPIGTQRVTISAHGWQDLENGGPVTVTEGHETTATFALAGKSRLEAKVVDAVTGQPVEGVCLVPAEPQHFMMPSECDQHSGADGTVVVEATTGWHQVLVFPLFAEGYGAQWVGAHSGTGSQLSAALIKVDEGKAGKTPLIKLDRAASISGTTQPGAGVAIGPNTGFLGGPGIGGTNADDSGHYELNALGPYRWPLQFGSIQNGTQWSGQVANRFLAQPVATGTTYNYQFKTAASVTVKVTGISGWCVLTANHLLTGDAMVTEWLEDCTAPVTIPMIGPQFVKFRIEFSDGRVRTHDSPVYIPSSGSKTINLN
jgi:hypothetical protein